MVLISPGDLVEIVQGCPGCAIENDPDIGKRHTVEWVEFSAEGEHVAMVCNLCGHRLISKRLVRLAGYEGYSDVRDATPDVFLKLIYRHADFMEHTGRETVN